MNEPIESALAKVALEATKYSLGVASIKPAADPSVSLNVELKAGYVIDLSRRADRPKAGGKVVEGAHVVVDAKPIE